MPTALGMKNTTSLRKATTTFRETKWDTKPQNSKEHKHAIIVTLNLEIEIYVKLYKFPVTILSIGHSSLNC